MRFFLSELAVLGLAFGFAVFSAFGGEPIPGEGAGPVPFERFDYPYFVKNTVFPPEGESALALICGSAESFSETFGIGMVMGKRPKLIEDGYFETHEVAALIQWGPVPWEYTVRSAVRTGNELVFKVTRTGTPSSSATFASRLILGLGRETLEGVETITFDFIPEYALPAESGETVSVGL